MKETGVLRFLTFAAASLGLVGAASADRPTNGALGFQPPATELAHDVEWVHNFILLPIITVISLLVLALLLWVMIRYNKKANPVPKTFSHNTTVEIVWTVGPVLILVVIAAFTFPLLYKVDRAPMVQSGPGGQEIPIAESEWINIKAQGNQWNWTYTYMDEVDEEGFAAVEFTSNPLQRGVSTDIEPSDPSLRYLEVDYPMVVPAGRYIRYYTAAADVIHSFAMPSFGIKTDAIPGRLAQGWFKVDQPGAYYGQCSELCGKDHAFMPIEIRVVPQEVYDQWYELMKAGQLDEAAALVKGNSAVAGIARDDTAR